MSNKLLPLLLSLPVVPLLAMIANRKRRRRGPALATPTSGGQVDLREMCSDAGLDAAWTIFFEAVAAHESGFDNLAGMGNPATAPAWAAINASEREAAAAATAYQRNSEALRQCPWAADRYGFGSGGWFALIPANAVAAFRGTSEECIDPWAVFDQAASLVMAIEMARRLRSWKTFNGTWLSLRAGWDDPSRMATPAYMADRFKESLEQVGADASFMYDRVTPLPPKDPVGLLKRLS